MTKRFSMMKLSLLAAALCTSQAFAADLPDAKTVLEKNLESTGGRAAMEKVKSRVSKLTMDIPAANINGTVTMYQQGENALLEADLAGVGMTRNGLSNGVAWESNPMTGVRVIEGAEKDQSMRSFLLNAELTPEKYYPKMQTTGEDTVDGRKCYKVELTSTDGKTETRWYDQENYRLLKSESTTQSQMGEMKAVSLFSEFKEFGGFTLPGVVKQQVANMEIVSKVVSVEDNVTIDPAKFELPDDVKKLMETSPTTKPQ